MIIIIFLFLAAAACKEKNTVLPSKKKITEAVYAPGYVMPENEYQVYAPVNGYLVSRKVETGDSVKAGEPLFVLGADQQEYRKRNAESAYNIALKNYREQSPVWQEQRAALASARARFQNDSLNFIRYRNLLRNNAIAAIEYDKVKLAYETAANELEVAKNRLQRTRDQLYLELENARSQYNIATREKRNYTVQSRINGKVYEFLKEPGEWVRINEPIAMLGAQHSFYLQLQVDELDIRKVRAGQPIKVKVDMFPDSVFDARVTKIYDMLNQQDQSFRVDAEFTSPLPFTLAGLNAEANIIISEKEAALVIPKLFLAAPDSVWVLQNEEPVKVKIIPGVSTIDEIEVLSGLSEHSRLIAAP